MSDLNIRFVPFNDGREEECQCARCGASTDQVDCDRCHGEGWYEGDRFGWDEGEFITCEECHGRGFFQVCGNDYEWCEAHPMSGRENMKRGLIEWFELAPSSPAHPVVEPPVRDQK